MILSDQYRGINSKEFKQILDRKPVPLKKQLTWTTIAHQCTKRYNETEHTVTGLAPKYLLEGKKITIVPSELKKNKIHSELLQDRKLALENSIKSHNYNKEQFDKKRKLYKYNTGDLVYTENGNRLNRKKLDELKIGPYKISEKISSSIYKIDTGHSKSQLNIFHITKLVPAKEFAVLSSDVHSFLVEGRYKENYKTQKYSVVARMSEVKC
ncbi:Transposon Ty3-I Gag-Pol polyprotein [Aphis craccivora]|uniref:Transposon Ty3-I Gag-Pol polyprotein n=1 Tax=Aphis craccivora TaxID=307492 RepID=A0A6G0Z9E9_APHCR|nr:Transposon Ty3-I Gag-Pol polyprotein [Aphis craccivora]